MRTDIGLIAVILALPAATFVLPGHRPPQAAAADLEPVTVAVVDRDSGTPVTAFAFQASYEAPGRKRPPNGDVWTPVTSLDGTTEIQAPPACLLLVSVKSPDYVADSQRFQEFVIKSDDRDRRVVVRLRRGITARGTVRDSRTKKPIAGVTVAPLTFMPPGSGPDVDRQVKTGANGRYEIRGVDPGWGVYIDHPDYEWAPASREDRASSRHQDLFLKPVPTFVVTVVDPAGKPLAGATAGWSNRRASGKDGRLVVRNASVDSRLTIRKDGYIDRELEGEEIGCKRDKPGGLVVVLEPLIALNGRVVAPDGRPVTTFAVAAGPGRLPYGRECIRRDVEDSEGRFSLNLSNEGTTWVGVAADGFAAWEGSVGFRRGGTPLEVRLAPGVAVSGRVVVPEALKDHVKVRLVPRRDKSDDPMLYAVIPAPEIPPETFATRMATPAANGTVRFATVRPDRYWLIIEGLGVARTARALDVPATGLDMGMVRIDLPTATGRIQGRVWHPKNAGGEPWAFAEGYVRGSYYEGPGEDGAWRVEFQADENGRFEVDHVPVGLSTVAFPYPLSADVIGAHTWSALVVEGQATRVRAFDPEGRREFTLAFAIGDGSGAQYGSGTGLTAARKVENVTSREPQFRMEIVPLPNDPRSFAEPGWEELDAQRKVVLPDVGPGRYQLRVHEWHGRGWLDSEALFDQEVVVPTGGTGEVRVVLGAGCITGKVPAPKEDFERSVEVTALATGSRTPSRRAYCDDDGNFCVRYLSPGTYALFINDPHSGFCRVHDVDVPAGVVDVGEQALSAGATVSGTIHFLRPSRVPREVVAVHASGASVRQWFSKASSFDQIQLAGLWPGRWTILARRGEQVLATRELDVEGTGTVHVTLTAGGGP